MTIHRSDTADSKPGRKSVAQSFSAKKHPESEEGDTRIIEPTGSGTNDRKYSAKIAWLSCLHQESCLTLFLKLFFNENNRGHVTGYQALWHHAVKPRGLTYSSVMIRIAGLGVRG